MRVFVCQEFLEQQPKHLQRHIFKGERWPVEQFKQPMLRIKLCQWRHCVMGKTGIGLSTKAAQILFGQAVTHKRLHDPHCGFGIAQPAQIADFGHRQ